MNTPEQTRRDQLAYGRTVISVDNTRAASTRPEVRPAEVRAFATPGSALTRAAPRVPPKGHDAILKAMQDNAQIATIITSGGGDVYVGTITGRDKYTITLLTDHPDATVEKKIRRVFYKSAIEQFWGEEVPRPTREVYRDEKVAA